MKTRQSHSPSYLATDRRMYINITVFIDRTSFFFVHRHACSDKQYVLSITFYIPCKIEFHRWHYVIPVDSSHTKISPHQSFYVPTIEHLLYQLCGRLIVEGNLFNRVGFCESLRKHGGDLRDIVLKSDRWLTAAMHCIESIITARHVSLFIDAILMSYVDRLSFATTCRFCSMHATKFHRESTLLSFNDERATQLASRGRHPEPHR